MQYSDVRGFYWPPQYIFLVWMSMVLMGHINFISKPALVMGISIIFLCLLSIPYFIQKLNLIISRYLLLIILFYWCLYSSLWSEYPVDSIQRVLIIFIPSFVLITLVAKDKNPIETFVRLAKFLVIFFAFVALFGLLLRIFGNISYVGGSRIEALSIGPITLYQTLFGVPPYYRITSITTNPNVLAIWMAISILFSVFLYTIKRISARTFWLLFVLQLFVLSLTISRAGIVTAAIILILFYSLGKKKGLLRLSFIFSIVIVILSFILVYDNNDLSNLRISTDLNYRGEAWQLLLMYIFNNPIFGSGFGVSSETILQRDDIGFAAHNAYLTMFSETGLVGGTLFLAVWFLAIYRSFILIKNSRRLKLTKEEHFSILVCFSFITALLIHQFFEGKVIRFDFIHFLWIYFIIYTFEMYNQKLVVKDIYIKR